MVSSSKILTVSYGTFSCTVEGFEDPLAVVKETTQFFRSVVQDDRFFGAEPPQLDSDLAEELFRQQVSARTTPNGLVLSPASQNSVVPHAETTVKTPVSPATSEPVAINPTPESLPPVSNAAMPHAVSSDTAKADLAGIELENPSLTTSADQTGGTPPIHAPLSEDTLPSDDLIEEEAARQLIEDDEAADPTISEIYTPSQDLTDDDADNTRIDQKALLSALAGYDANEEHVSETSAPASTAPEKENEGEDKAPLDILETTTNTSAPALAGGDIITNKLARIRAVVSGTANAETTENITRENNDDLTSSVTNKLEASSEFGKPDVVDEQQNEAPQAVGFEDSIAPFSDTSDTIVFKDEAEGANQPTTQNRTTKLTRILKVRRSDFEAAIAADPVEDIHEDEGLIALTSDDDVPEDTGATPTLSLEAEDDLTRELQAIAEELSLNDPANTADDAAARMDVNVPPETSKAWDADAQMDVATKTPLRREDPLRLENALNATHTPTDQGGHETSSQPAPEFGANATTDETANTKAADSVEEGDLAGENLITTARKAIKMANPVRAMLTETTVKDGDAFRLMEETDTQFDEPEGNRRRSAIAHLRAAVAATRADQKLGKKSGSEEDPYREDLANVVRPRSTKPSQSRSERPSAIPAPQQAQAPLTLIAEQRVQDKATYAAETQIQPRRVDRATRIPPEHEIRNGFAVYADEVGAHNLSEKLEAAAAFLSFIEGRDQFSRPQLMTILRDAETAESSREDRLRNFGRLLREGKIEKTPGGRFTASQSIGFQPERAAG